MIPSQQGHSGRAALHAIIDSCSADSHRDLFGRSSCAYAANTLGAQIEFDLRLGGYLEAIADTVRTLSDQAGTAMDTATEREEAVAMLCQMVGAVMVSRSVSQVNKDLSGEVLTLSSARLKRAWQR